MQVKQRLTINAVISVASALVILLVFSLALYRLNKANNLAKISGDIVLNSFERVTLRNDYLQNSNERAKAQWFARHEAIGKILKSASKTFQDPEDKKTIDELFNNHESIIKIFSAIVENREKNKLTSDDAVISQEVEDRLLSQLNIKVYEAVLHGRELLESGREARSSALRFAGGWTASVLIFLIGAIIINSRSMGRAITDRVRRLRDGALVIGGGDLDHRIDIKGDDEFAELSGAFNAMTTKLKTTYHELSTEVEERKRAEEKIRRHNAVLNGINTIFKEAIASKTEEDIAIRCLRVAEEITESRFGFIGEIGPDGLLHDIAISNPGWELCTMYDKTGHRRPPGDFKLHGIYGRVLLDGKSLFTNDPPAHPDSIGTPVGHPPLRAFLGVPLLHDGNTIGIVGLGNHEGGYRQEDLELIEALAPAIIATLQKRRAEEALSKAYDDLEIRVQDRTKELRDAETSLREINETLEQRVAERTFELRASNASLRDSRLAALNLMEDSLAASKQAEEVNAELVQEVAERKRSEEALRESRGDMSRAQEVGNIGSWRLDVRRNVLTWSDENHRIFGIPKGTPLTYETFLSTIHPDDREYVDTQWKAGLRGEPYDIEHRLVVDGQIKWVREKAYLEFDKDGSLLGGFGITQDITARRQSEAEILKLGEDMAARNLELELLNKELEAFIYSVSHDLRGPLRTMAAFVSFLYEEYSERLDNQAKDYLTRISQSSAKMSKLIEDLLDLSKLSRQEVNRTEVDMSALVTSIASGHREAEPGRNVEISVEAGVKALADPSLTEIVLSNLIGNAWKFTSKTTNTRIEFGTIEKDGKTVYYVRDNGAGFDPQYAAKMFQPFHRFHSGEEFEGTGIGLSIVERIIRRLGGKVWAEGEVGKGAKVYFTLG